MLLCHFGISAVIILYSGCNHLLHAKNGDYYFPSCNAIKYCWKLWSFFITFFYFLCCCLELWSEMNLQSGDGKNIFGPFHCRTILSFSYEKMHFFQKSYFNIRNAFYWFNSWYHQPPVVVKERNLPTFLSKDIYIVFNKRFIKLFLASFDKSY